MERGSLLVSCCFCGRVFLDRGYFLERGSFLGRGWFFERGSFFLVRVFWALFLEICLEMEELYHVQFSDVLER